MNTAIDFYSRGKEKEAEARDFPISAWYPRGRFICPECGEDVCLTRSKYKNFFRHYKRTEQTPECERRVDSTPSESIFKRIGLPLYLKEELSGLFKLYIGFRALSESDLNRAEKNCCEVVVNGRLRYRVNRERFSSSHSYWMPIDFAPYNEYYTISYTGNGTNQKVLKENWGDYAEAFMNCGALFKGDGRNRRKLHKGDSIATDTEYYWLIQDEQRLNGVPGVHHTRVGKLALSNRIYYILRVVFKSDISDHDFEITSRFLLRELKIHLLEKAAELVPIWPPAVRQNDGYLTSDLTQFFYGAVKSGNSFPNIYGYYENNPVPVCLSAGIESIVTLPVGQRHQYFTVDRKNVSTGLTVEKGDWSTNGCCLKRTVLINGEPIDCPDIFNHNEDRIFINLFPKADVTVFRKNVTVESSSGETQCEIKTTTSSDKILVFNNAEFLLLIQKEDVEEVPEELTSIKEIERCIIKYSDTYKVSIPLEIRKRLSMNSNKSILIKRILVEGKIPLVLLQYMERNKNVQQ